MKDETDRQSVELHTCFCFQPSLPASFRYHASSPIDGTREDLGREEQISEDHYLQP